MKKIDKFLSKLILNFNLSKKYYDLYIEHNKKFIYARILKKVNKNIRNILINDCYLMPYELHSDTLKLIEHYDIWLENWNYLYNTNRNIKLNDEFVFQNEHMFPKKSEQNIINLFNKKTKE